MHQGTAAHSLRNTALVLSYENFTFLGSNLYGCVRFDSGKLSSAVSDVRQGLEGRLSQWAEYQGSMDRLLAWLSESEMALKNYSTLNNLEEKQDQLNKYQVSVSVLLLSVDSWHDRHIVKYPEM